MSMAGAEGLEPPLTVLETAVLATIRNPYFFIQDTLFLFLHLQNVCVFQLHHSRHGAKSDSNR